MCDFTDRLIQSLQSFELSGELYDVLDTHLNLEDNAIFGPELTANIKEAIVDEAVERTNSVTSSIIDRLGTICSSTRPQGLRGMISIEHDGSTDRLLRQSDLTFNAISEQLRALPGVMQSSGAGYFIARNALAIDLDMHIEEVFGREDFADALARMFDRLGPAKAMFGANDESANVQGLLDDASLSVAFDLSVTFGIKIQPDFMNFFNHSEDNNRALLNGTLSLNRFSVSAEAHATGLTTSIFPGLDLTGGEFSLSTGVSLAMPLEMELDLNGNFANGIGLGKTITGRLSWIPVGQVMTSLPFYYGDQGLRIIFQDEDLFDNRPLMVSVDFDVCQAIEALQLMIGRLGSLQFEPDNILGPNVPFSGIDIGESFNDFFPDAGSFMNRVLEGELCPMKGCLVVILFSFAICNSVTVNGEVLHLCTECQSKDDVDCPRFVDVIELIKEEVFGQEVSTVLVSDATSVSSRRRHRALRAHHLPYNNYKRFRTSSLYSRRHLQEDTLPALLGDLLDSLTVNGSYDGTVLSLELTLDLSKQNDSFGLDDIIESPLRLLNEVPFLRSLFPQTDEMSSSSSFQLDTDSSFSAGAHISVLGETIVLFDSIISTTEPSQSISSLCSWV